jgi:DNA polymerase (family X)
VNNQELAQVFSNIADLLEIKGEVVYKVLAYRRAAESLREYNRDAGEAWRAGELRQIPGVGAAIAEKIEEMLSTGQLGFYEKLKAEIPVGLVDMLAVPDVGPRKVALFWKKLGITTLPELEQAARQGKLRDLAGMGEKSETKILAGIESLAKRVATGRRPLGVAWPIAQELLGVLRALPGVRAAEVAGSLRRRRSTIGDLDLLVAATDAGPIMDAFIAYPGVGRVLGHGTTKSSVEFVNGLQADLRVLPPERFGTLLQHFTGSKEHNVKLRELALRQGLSLSEHAFTTESGEEILCATEADVYKRLGLEFIPPEMREDRGEIEAAANGQLPRLLEVRDLRSDLHSHTTWSDGALSLRDMAFAARDRGLKALAITDHSQSLGVAGGLTLERLRAQRQELDSVMAELGPGFCLLQGSEVEIRSDGRLDFSDDVLDDLDIVVASMHTGLRQERGQVTARLISAIQNRHVDIIGHPTGRLFPDRQGADLDMEAVLRAAADAGVALEINANPARLDLDDAYAMRALELGCLLSINTDAHHSDQFALAHFGVGVARRAWATTDRIINTWTPEKLLHWLDSRRNHRSSSRRPASKAVSVDTPAAPKPQPASQPAATAESPDKPKPAARSTRKTSPRAAPKTPSKSGPRRTGKSAAGDSDT